MSCSSQVAKAGSGVRPRLAPKTAARPFDKLRAGSGHPAFPAFLWVPDREMQVTEVTLGVMGDGEREGASG